nr:ribonuclease E/G [Tabrizicola sp.]
IARQLRLRDLAGLIVIDFIDMEERRNNATVEKRLKDKLKTDRARIQVGRISGFGLLEMSRQRLRPGMLESTTQPCPHCHGTGLIRSDDSMALTVLRALEEEGTRKRSKEVLLKAPVGIVNYLFNAKREHVALIEARYGMAVRIEADPMMVSPDYSIEKFKTAIRAVPETPVVSGHAGLMGAPVEEEEDEDIVDDLVEEEAEEAAEVAAAPAAQAAGDGDGQPGRKKRRRRRRRRGGQRDGAAPSAAEAGAEDDGDDEADGEGDTESEAVADDAVAVEAASTAKPKRVRKPRGAKAAAVTDAAVTEAVVTDAAVTEAAPVVEVAAAPVVENAPAPKKRASRAKAQAPEAASAAPEVEVAAEPAAKPAKGRGGRAKASAKDAAPALAPDPGLEPVAETVVADPGEAAAPAPEPDEPAKPKRKGWWSLGR